MVRQPIPNLGFDDLLAQADLQNRRRQFDRLTSHLPSEMEAAIKHHRKQIKDYHAAMLAGEWETARRIKIEAHDMAVRVNHGEPGILANRDLPGYVIATRCAAKPARCRAGDSKADGPSSSRATSRWAKGRRRPLVERSVRIDLEGMFGLAAPGRPSQDFRGTRR